MNEDSDDPEDTLRWVVLGGVGLGGGTPHS